MIEFPAVIQEITVTPDATTIHLDAVAHDLTALADLVDQEVTVAVRPARTATSDHPSRPTPPKRTQHKGASPECA